MAGMAGRAWYIAVVVVVDCERKILHFSNLNVQAWRQRQEGIGVYRLMPVDRRNGMAWRCYLWWQAIDPDLVIRYHLPLSDRYLSHFWKIFYPPPLRLHEGKLTRPSLHALCMNDDDDTSAVVIVDRSAFMIFCTIMHRT